MKKKKYESQLRLLKVMWEKHVQAVFIQKW